MYKIVNFYRLRKYADLVQPIKTKEEENKILLQNIENLTVEDEKVNI
jgi:hypothetical protein